jgi:hypothetical protein
MEQTQNKTQNKTQENIIKKYIEQMSEIEKIAFEIAKKNLESSFDIEKSIGFIEFNKNNTV